MNEILATVQTAVITDENADFYFCQLTSSQTAALAKSEGTYQRADKVAGFIYEDLHGQLRLTVQLPSADRLRYGWGTVTEVRRDLGVFADIGLADKDVVVSLDDLPEDKAEWPKKGDQLYIKLILDKKNRLWGQLAWQEEFVKLADPGYDNMQNEDLRAIVYRNRETGTFVYLPDNNMLAFIHPTERLARLRIGQELQVRVIGFRKEDRTLYVSAKPRAHEMLDKDAEMLLTYLKMQGGTMPFNDKSAPEAIQATFAISKGQFKKALGGLMKQKKIKQTTEGTELL